MIVIVIVMKLDSRILVLCSLERGQVDRRRLGDVIKGDDDDGPSILGDGGVYHRQ